MRYKVAYCGAGQWAIWDRWIGDYVSGGATHYAIRSFPDRESAATFAATLPQSPR